MTRALALCLCLLGAPLAHGHPSAQICGPLLTRGNPLAHAQSVLSRLDSSVLMRRQALVALRGDPRAIPTLRAALDDPEARIREAAAWALSGARLTPATLAAMVRVGLTDPHAGVRNAIAVTLQGRRRIGARTREKP